MRSIRDCNVCVVGGAGFLGSHLCHHLVDDRNCNVLVLDNLVTGKREFLPEKSTTFVHCDINGSETNLRRLFEHYEIEYVFNYAAEPYIPLSFKRPVHVFNTNAFGAIKVINAAQEAGCEGILQVSSAEIYGGLAPGKISENAPTNPHSSYGASKLAIDALVQARWHEAETPCIALRQFNCIGERETHPYVVPEIISQLFSQKGNTQAEVSLGNNSQRDFQYAGDAVRMAVELLEKGQFGEVYNMGSEKSISIYDLAQKIGGILGFIQTDIITDIDRRRPWEIWSLQSDNTKLYSVIDGRPEVSLFDALLRTARYHNSIGGKWSWE